MDGQAAIEGHGQALRRIVTTLFTMAGITPGATGPVGTVPRSLRNAVYRLLRPAEAAARRLVIALAGTRAVQDRIVPLSRRAPCPGGPSSNAPLTGRAPCLVRPSDPLKGKGELPRAKSPSQLWAFEGQATQGARRDQGGSDISGYTGRRIPSDLGDTSRTTRARRATLPLFDALRRPSRRGRERAVGLPRISLPGVMERTAVVLRPAPSAHDRLDAARMALRLSALVAALDDLPRHALRFARWQARRELLNRLSAEALAEAAAAAPVMPLTRNGGIAGQPAMWAGGTRIAAGRFSARLRWPLKPGRPPGWQRRDRQAVHDILDETQAMALAVLTRAAGDTS